MTDFVKMSDEKVQETIALPFLKILENLAYSVLFEPNEPSILTGPAIVTTVDGEQKTFYWTLQMVEKPK